MSDIPLPPTLGLVLAGGLARRMGGGDKARIEIGGVTILDRVLARLSGRNARHHPQRQRRSGALRRHRPAGDSRRRAGFRRPARRHPGRARLGGRAGHRRRMAAQRAGRLSVPAARSGRAAAQRPARRWAPACRSPARAPANGGIRWSACGRWRCAPDLRQALVEEGLRKIEIWTARHGVALADWPAEPVDPFFNVNTPEDAARPSALRCNITASDALDPARAARIFAIIASYGAYGRGADSMKTFVIACVAAIIIAVIGGVRAQQRAGAGRQGVQ